jgi:hypothetical protein
MPIFVKIVFFIFGLLMIYGIGDCLGIFKIYRKYNYKKHYNKVQLGSKMNIETFEQNKNQIISILKEKPHFSFLQKDIKY